MKRFFRFGLVFLYLAFMLTMPNKVHATNVQASGNSETNSSVSSQSVSPLSIENVSTNSLLIRFAEGTTAKEVKILEKNHGYIIDKFWPQFNIAKLIIPSQDISASSADVIHQLDVHSRSLEERPEVLDAGYNYVIQVPETQQGQYTDGAHNVVDSSDHIFTPNDPLYPDQWGARRIGAVNSWEICQGNSSVVIALIDSGYDTGHPDISADSLWVNEIELNGVPGVDDDQNGFIDDVNGWDWIDNDSNPNDELGHGTHVGGTIRAVSNNSIGISGTAPKVKIMPLRILREDGKGEIADLIDALAYALRKGIRIANLSLVSYYNAPALEEAVKIAYNEGMLMVAATGNLATRVYWPAAYDETLAVTATTEGDVIGSFSNFGKEVDIAAPGVNIISTYNDYSYFTTSGTSMATPYVSALASLILSLRPDYTLDNITSTIKDTAEDIGIDPQFVGDGLVSFYDALWTASKDLKLSAAEKNSKTVFAESSVAIKYRVTTPTQEQWMVHGAVVHYQLVSGDDSEVLIERYEVSNAQGIATFEFNAPNLPGGYLIKIKVGATDPVSLPLFVQTHPDSIVLYSPVGQLDPNDSTWMRLRIRDAAGELLLGPTPVEIQTTSGSLPPGSRIHQGIAIDGEYIFTLEGDEKIGTVTVTANVGKLTERETIDIVAGAPSTIDCSDAMPLEPLHNINRISFDCVILDDYGNPVRDGTEISISPNQLLSTQDGQVTVSVDLPTNGTEAVISDINIVGTDISVMISVPIYDHYLWLPIMQAR